MILKKWKWETVDVKVAHPGDNAYALTTTGLTRQLRPSVYAISIDSKLVVGLKHGSNTLTGDCYRVNKPNKDLLI